MPDANTLFAAAERADRTVELDMACLSVVADGLNGLDPGGLPERQPLAADPRDPTSSTRSS